MTIFYRRPRVPPSRMLRCDYIEYFEVRHPLIRIEMPPTSGYEEKIKRPRSLFITGEMTFLPFFVVVRKLGWFDGYAALVIPPLFGASGIFRLCLFFRNIPRDLEDPARIDGCAVIGIILPLGKSAQVSLGLFAFIGEWGRFLRPLVVMNLREGQPIQLGISHLRYLLAPHPGDHRHGFPAGGFSIHHAVMV